MKRVSSQAKLLGIRLSNAKANEKRHQRQHRPSRVGFQTGWAVLLEEATNKSKRDW